MEPSGKPMCEASSCTNKNRMISAHNFVNTRTMNYSTDTPVPVLTCFEGKEQ